LTFQEGRTSFAMSGPFCCKLHGNDDGGEAFCNRIFPVERNIFEFYFQVFRYGFGSDRVWRKTCQRRLPPGHKVFRERVWRSAGFLWERK